MAKHTVTDFGIEVQFSEKVMAGLTKLESQVMKACVQMEKNLSKTFKPDHTKHLTQSITALGQNANRVFQDMGRNLRTALDVRLNTRNMFGSVVSDATRAAHEADRILSRINGGHGGNRRNPPTGGSGNPPSARPPRAGNGIGANQRLTNSFNTSALMTRLEMAGGNSTLFARQMQSRVAMAQVTHGENTQAFRRELARLTLEMRQHEQAIRRDTAAANAEERARLAAARAEQRRQSRDSTRSRRPVEGGGVAAGAKSTMLGMLGANVITMAVGAALKVAKEAYVAGAERGQANTMMGAAFGDYQKQMTERAAVYSAKYGADQTDTMKQLSILRQTMPAEKFSNMDLMHHMENMNVYAHATGVNNEAVGRANYAISQIAGSAKINRQDINQLTGAIPSALAIIAKDMGISKTKLIAQFKTLDPSVLLKHLENGMKTFNESTGAAVKAQQSIQASQGRLTNAWQNDLVALFEGTGASVNTWMDRLTQSLIFMQPVFKRVGENVKAVSDAFTYVGGKIIAVKKAFDDFYNSLSPETLKMLDVLKTGFLDFFKWMGKAFVDVFMGVVTAIKKMFAWVASLAGDAENDGVKRSEKYGNSVEAGSAVEKFLNWLDTRHDDIQKDKNGVSPMLESLKANALQAQQSGDQYGFNSGSYDRKAEAARAGNQYDLGAKIPDIGFKPVDLAGDVTVTVNFDEGSLNRAIAKVAGQTTADTTESQHVNAAPMGGGWQRESDNVGWNKTGDYSF